MRSKRAVPKWRKQAATSRRRSAAGGAGEGRAGAGHTPRRPAASPRWSAGGSGDEQPVGGGVEPVPEGGLRLGGDRQLGERGRPAAPQPDPVLRRDQPGRGGGR